MLYSAFCCGTQVCQSANESRVSVPGVAVLSEAEAELLAAVLLAAVCPQAVQNNAKINPMLKIRFFISLAPFKIKKLIG